MPTESLISVPDIGDFKDVEVIEVAVKTGDHVEIEQTLITIESEKASVDIPSPGAGEVREMRVKVGDRVSRGSPILMLAGADREKTPVTAAKTHEPATPVAETPDAPAVKAIPEAIRSPQPAGSTPRPAPATPTSSQTVGSSRSARAYASPSVRRFARELGVDLGLVRGAGRKGRILLEDVKAFTKAVMSDNHLFERGGGGFSLPQIPPVDFSKFGPVEARPLTRLKKLGAQNLHRSWINVPHVTQFDEADITELEAFRKSKLDDAKRRGLKLTLLTFLINAVVVALRKYPDFNASLNPEGDSLVLKGYYHIGFAVNTNQGLVVPVIRDADQKGLFELAKEVAELADKARAQKLKAADMQGGCFSISSLGHIGGTGFTPIINTPEVAILGVSRATMKPVFKDGKFEPRLILPYSLSYDHRVIDGVAAAEFTQYLGTVLTDIRDILL